MFRKLDVRSKSQDTHAALKIGHSGGKYNRQVVLTATLASIGTAGVPGAGMVMLVIVLEAVGVPVAGIALIVAPDRILDMCRTVVNITGRCYGSRCCQPL